MSFDRDPPRAWAFLIFLALAYVVIELQWVHRLVWDEIEFFRATRWVAEGRVPFRDFWEHHLPLQWILFAPVAAIFGDGPGASSIVAMRWAQLPLVIALFIALDALMRRAALALQARLAVLVALAASPLFVHGSIEFRVDAVGNLAYFGGLVVVVRSPRSRGAWIAFGALMSAAVLANIRMAPIVLVTGVLALFFRSEERRWRWNGIALWMSAGIALVVLSFVGWLASVDALDPFIDAMRLNFAVDRMHHEEAKTLTSTLLLPVTMRDAAAIALLLAGIAGTFIALREIRRPGPLQLLALLAIASVAAYARLGVHYGYHLQMTVLLLVPLAASVLRHKRTQVAALVFLAIVVAVDLARTVEPLLERPMLYQDTVMREADRRTTPNEKVFDGCGFALQREPAYRYWFLPSAVRMPVARGMLEPYGAPQMIDDPPAAIIHSYRVHLWLKQFPAAKAYATHHYIPLYRDLWIPALSAAVEPRGQVMWIAPRAGQYRLYASELLLQHPWFRDPLHYAMSWGPDASLLTVSLDRIPSDGARGVQIAVDDQLIHSPVITLRKGSLVQLRSARPARIGVIIVPADVTTIFIEPDGDFVM